MKRMTPKIIITGIFVIFLTSAIPNVLWTIFGEGERPDDIKPGVLLLGGFITVSISLSLFSFILNRIVIRRVKELDTATKKVMEGNYCINIKDRHPDEIGNLINNFNKMTEALNQNEYINKEFARNFSHEMKTPLSAIKGYADLIRNNDITEEEKEKYINIIIEESTRLSTLSKNMLMISQIDNQVIIQKEDEFNVAELLRNVIQLQQIDWEEKQLELDLDIEDFNIISNKELMYQVIENLISNAIKYSNMSNTISVVLKNENGLFLSISNQGNLSEEEINNIFQLFYVTDKSRTSKSSGVGLTLTKKIIEKLEGTIDVTSRNQRITFEVRL
jgi:signal transduction histidine kinase